MKTSRLIALVALVGMACHVEAAVVFYTSFDVGVQGSGPAPAPYPGAPGDILAGSTNVLNSPDAVNYMINSTGPQGGQAYLQARGATWPNQQGYTFGNLPTSTPAGGGGPDKFVAVEYTIEALVKPDFSDTGFGLGVAKIFDSQHLGDGSAWGDVTLYVNQNTGQVSFEPSSDPNGQIASTINLQSGLWYHIAAVVRTSGVQRTELWINNQLAGTGNYPGTWETIDLFRIAGYFNLGGWYWANGQNWQGEIDAFAISDVALAPDSFAIPEPSIAALIGTGGLLLAGKRRRGWLQ